MIQIRTTRRVGAQDFTLAHAYDNKSTLARKLKSYAKDGRQTFVDTVVIAEKTLHLIYVR